MTLQESVDALHIEVEDYSVFLLQFLFVLPLNRIVLKVHRIDVEALHQFGQA